MAVGDVKTFAPFNHRSEDPEWLEKGNEVEVVEDLGWEKKIRLRDGSEVRVAAGELQ